ncbi:MAG TPA: MarR family transcriptional regulator [Solirubrobacteraceae bacterium]|nr:MarR family transcriptional regulator [Solirubrobacteraceae bacterium]
MADDLLPADAALELRAVLGALYRRIRQTKELGELSGPESAALSRLGHHGAMAAAELARYERISPQSIASTVRGLIDKGLVERKHDPTDGRRLILSLTAAGRDTVEHRRAARAEQLHRALSALAPSERAQLLAALPALRRLAREL